MAKYFSDDQGSLNDVSQAETSIDGEEADEHEETELKADISSLSVEEPRYAIENWLIAMIPINVKSCQ